MESAKTIYLSGTSVIYSAIASPDLGYVTKSGDVYSVTASDLLENEEVTSFDINGDFTISYNAITQNFTVIIDSSGLSIHDINLTFNASKNSFEVS